MKRIEIRLSLPVVAPIIDALHPIAESLREDLAAPMRLEDLDPDFREFWREELLQGQNDEIKVLLGLFNDEFFSTGLIFLDAQNGLAVLRASSALRLRLRSTHLRQLPDTALEGGEVAPESLPDGPRQALLAYVFLATLQDLVIKNLGAELLEGPPPAPEEETDDED